jgi:hypothetical protein
MKQRVQRMNPTLSLGCAFVLIMAGGLAVVGLLAGIYKPSQEISIGIAAVSTFFAAISSLASLVAITEAQREREQRERPYIYAYFDAASSGLIYFVIENAGNSPALDVSISFHDPVPERHDGTPLNSLSLFQNVISFMPPGKNYRQYVDIGPSLLKEDKPKAFTFTVSYRSANGKPYKEIRENDISYMKEATRPLKSIEDHLSVIADSIGKLTQQVNQTSNWGALLVETPEQQRKRIDRELMDEQELVQWRRFLISMLNRFSRKLRYKQ